MAKTPRLTKALIITNPALEAAVTQAQQALDTAAETLLATYNKRVQVETVRTGADPQDAAKTVYDTDVADLEALREKLEAAQAALVPAIDIYEFRPLGWKAWRALTAAHPARNKTEPFNVDAIAPALLRDASHNPRLSNAQVEDILTSEDWSQGEVMQLINAAVEAQS